MSAEQTIGKYRIERVLGRGAMGVVYLASDPDIGRQVAIKTLLVTFSEHEEVLERFQREARAAGALSHPNVVVIYEFGVHEGSPFIVMEYIAGLDLQKVLRRDGPLDRERVVDLVTQVLKGLAYCHSHEVFHRDLKPANIVLMDDGVAKITDFGIARMEGSELTATGSALGTPSYMSPEQVEGKHVDGRSDLFSVGVILYEMLTGARPFEGESVHTIMYNVVNTDVRAPVELAPDVPDGLNSAVQKALAKDPAQRFQSAAEFVDALAQSGATSLQELPTVLGSSNTVAASADRPAASALRKVAVAAVLVFALVGSGWWFLGDTQKPQLGSVSMTTEPAGVTVWLDGNELGRTPLSAALPVGTHLLTLKKEAYLDQQVSVEVAPDSVSDVYLPLTPK